MGVYYLLENYTIITANLKGGRQQSRGGRFPPLENTLRSSFHQNFEETKGVCVCGSLIKCAVCAETCMCFVCACGQKIPSGAVLRVLFTPHWKMLRR